LKINLTNEIINIKVKDLAEIVSIMNFGLKEKIEFLEADEYEMETIMNVKVCKMILFGSDNADVIILMKELFDKELTLEELNEINDKLICAFDKQMSKSL